MNINDLYENGVVCEVCGDKYINTEDIKSINKKGMCWYCGRYSKKRKKKTYHNIVDRILRGNSQPSSN